MHGAQGLRPKLVQGGYYEVGPVVCSGMFGDEMIGEDDIFECQSTHQDIELETDIVIRESPGPAKL